MSHFQTLSVEGIVVDPISIVIEYLKSQKVITSLEQDILDTWNELRKKPLDRNSAFVQVQKNNINHPDVLAAILASPTTVQKPWGSVTDEDIRSNLSAQLDALLQKEQEARADGQ